MVDEQYSKVKAVLKEYESWKSLPCRDALEQYEVVQSHLSSIASMSSDFNVPQLCEPCPKISFQMSGMSEMLSFGHLGKIVVGGVSIDRSTSQSEGNLLAELEDDADPLSDLHVPPTKKRRGADSS
jgi:hypothetical protein